MVDTGDTVGALIEAPEEFGVVGVSCEYLGLSVGKNVLMFFCEFTGVVEEDKLNGGDSVGVPVEVLTMVLVGDDKLGCVILVPGAASSKLEGDACCFIERAWQWLNSRQLEVDIGEIIFKFASSDVSTIDRKLKRTSCRQLGHILIRPLL